MGALGTVALHRNVVLKSSLPWFWYEHIHHRSVLLLCVLLLLLLFYCVFPLVIVKQGCDMVLSLSELTGSIQHVAILRWEVGEQSPISASTSDQLLSR